MGDPQNRRIGMNPVTHTFYRLPLACALAALLSPAWPLVPASRAAEFMTLDLAPHWFRSWHNFQPHPLWNPPPGGRQTLNEIPWDLSGVVQLFGYGRAHSQESRPPSITLSVEQRFTVLHLLHFTEFVASRGEAMVRVVFRYDDGQENDIVLRYGLHVLDWRHAYTWPSVGDPASSMIWQAPHPAELHGPFATVLCHTPLANPRPDAAVRTIELRSLFPNASYSLAAVTLQHDPPASDPILDPGRHPTLEPQREPTRQVIRLVDAEDGAPVAHAIVTAWVHLDDVRWAWGKYPTDESGRTTLHLPSHGIGRIDLIAVGREHAPIWTTAPPPTAPPSGQPPSEFVIELNRGRTIGGRVVDIEREPVAQAAVVASHVLQAHDGNYIGYDWPKTQSDADGTWSVHAAPEDIDLLTLHVSHPDFLPAGYEQDTSPLPYTVTRTELLSGRATLELSRGLSLTGRVADDEGAPLASAQITLFEGSTPRADRRVTIAGADGRFQLGPLSVGDARVLVRAPGYAPLLLPVRLEPDMEPLRLTLARASSLRLQLAEATGEPVVGAHVMLVSWEGDRWLDWFARTDRDGRIDWAEAPSAAEYQIWHPDHAPQLARLEPANDILDLAMGGNRITGLVLDDTTGEPVSTFVVIPGMLFAPQHTNWERHRAQTGRDGRFSLREDAPEQQGIRGIQRRVMVEAPGYLPAVSDAVRAPTNLVLRLTQGTGPKGIVRGPDGLPVSGAEVTMAAENRFVHMDQPPSFRQMGSGTLIVQTDSNGSFELPAQVDIRAVYAAHEQGLGVVSHDDLARTGTIQLQPWGRVEGVLKVGDAVTEDQTVSLHRPQGRPIDDRPAGRLALFLRTQPDPDGRFVFPLVPPVELEAALQWPPHPSHEIAWSHPVQLTVRSAATNHIVIGGTGRTVIGRVRIEGLQDGELDFQRDVQRLRRVPQVRPPDLRPPDRAVSPEAMQTAMQEHQQRLRTFWESEDGRRAALDSGSYVLRFQSDGSFRCDNVPPGTYSLVLRFTRAGAQPWEAVPLLNHSREISIPDESEPLDLGELVLRAGASP
jgi:hypothetical protein